jgi:hypothetical protein
MPGAKPGMTQNLKRLQPDQPTSAEIANTAPMVTSAVESHKTPIKSHTGRG